jgi:hypothetical protein
LNRREAEAEEEEEIGTEKEFPSLGYHFRNVYIIGIISFVL